MADGLFAIADSIRYLAYNNKEATELLATKVDEGFERLSRTLDNRLYNMQR